MTASDWLYGLCKRRIEQKVHLLALLNTRSYSNCRIQLKRMEVFELRLYWKLNKEGYELNVCEF